jgi:hypothetical protein
LCLRIKWEVLSVHNTRRKNVVGFDHEAAVKRNLPIVCAITAVDLPYGISVLLFVNEAIYNDTANRSFLSEFHSRLNLSQQEGTQKMVIQDVDCSLVITLELAGCMTHFRR